MDGQRNLQHVVRSIGSLALAVGLFVSLAGGVAVAANDIAADGTFAGSPIATSSVITWTFGSELPGS